MQMPLDWNDPSDEHHEVRTAGFSACRTWRYTLIRGWRAWDMNTPDVVAWIGLNPSMADEATDDPTIRRCIRFSEDWGFAGMVMLNAYAFRATLPQNMKAGRRFSDGPVLTDDPVGPDNDRAIKCVCEKSMLVVAAWGVHCEPARAEQVLSLIDQPVYCLGRTKVGHPKHPLYIRSDKAPEPFWKPGP